MGGFGRIAFLGCVHFAQGLFVGVELDEAKGKHDGAYHGKRYFTAKERHGVLVKQHRVELLPNKLEPSEENEENDNEENAQRAENALENERLMALLAKEETEVDSLSVLLDARTAERDEQLEEKVVFEAEMNGKMEEMERRLQMLRAQLLTKDEVLKRQIAQHENTKNKLQRKIEEHETLKRRNLDTQHLIYYGDAKKDDEIEKHRNKLALLRRERDECLLQREQVSAHSQQNRSRAIQQWLFDFGV